MTKNLEFIQLVYLDINDINKEIQSNVLEINPSTKFYTNIQLCIEYLQTNSFDNKIFLILTKNCLLDLIHSYESIIAIFLYDQTDSDIKKFQIKYPKLIDQYKNEYDLYESIKEYLQLIERQSNIYYLFNPNEKFRNDLTKESACFIWQQMLINILQQTPDNQDIRDEVFKKSIEYYRTNPYELAQIELFRENYSSEQAIDWYIKERFLYKLINNALRTANIEVLYGLRFFLMDLCDQIKKQYDKIEKHDNFIVYRGQIMLKDEIKQFQNNLNSLISINGFFLASYDKNIELKYLEEEHLLLYDNVLLEIYIENQHNNILYADLSSFNLISKEKDILFYFNSSFKIFAVDYDMSINLWVIKITTDHQGFEQVNQYLKWIENETDYNNSMIYFGHLLWNHLGEINQAQNYFEILFESLPNDHPDIPNIYIELGHIHDKLKDYNLALKNYQDALDYYEKQTSNDSFIHIALCLNYLGLVHQHLGNNDNAIDYYRQSLNIYETKYSKDENRLYQANTLLNLGLVYQAKNDLDTALTYLTLAHNIRCDILPNDDPLLSNSLSHLGNIYYEKKDYQQALDHYQLALSIDEINFPNDHRNKIDLLYKLALIYRDQEDCTNALNSLNRLIEIESNSSSSSHLAIYYGDIGNIHEKLHNYDLATENYEKQYEIEEKFLPINHPNLIQHLDLITHLLKKKDSTDKAIDLCQNKLTYLKKLLQNDYENHPRTARIYILLANIYEDKNPKQSDHYYQKSLTILENNKTEEIFSKSLSIMTNFYWKCRMFDRALICQMKLLQYRRSILINNDNDIAYTLRGLARLYRVMNKTSEALDYFEQSLKILQQNYGSQHIDVVNIQKEIFDLKDIVKSISSTANEDYNNRRISNAHKQLLTMSETDLKSTQTRTISKSSTCNIL